VNTASVKKNAAAEAKSSVDSPFYSFVVKSADGKDVALSEYKNKYVLVVNVASKCGFTSQYEGLEKLYANYKDKGLVVIGFPSNQFLGQEPGTDAEIQKFCKLTYGVTFPVFAKVEVKGEGAIPLYKWLTSVPGFSGTISWNFNKFLLNRSGELVKRYGSRDKPEAIERDLKETFGF
jgi:glutathione peroxidase